MPKRNLIATYEVEMGAGDEKISLNITLSKIKYKNNEDAIYGNITNISEHQRELSMQAEMLSLITAQMEVQQAGIKEQNDVLSQQHKRLEEQAQKLTDAFQELELRNKQITIKTNYITDSIKYAQTIQEAMLPGEDQLAAFFDNFIVFRPKDIVSGDFYWMSITPEYTFAAVGDCTGHGVPGAFMSLIGNRILNEVINVKKTYSPRDIMDQLNKNVIKALKQDQSTNNDGMDTCFCRIGKIGVGDYSVTFCGAKRPLYYFTSTEEDVKMLKGDRKSIGGTQQKRGNIEFTNQEVIMHSGDIMYLSSDGIIDQNDADRKRFGTDNFLAMLKKYKNEPMSRQGEYFAMTLDNYRKGEEQRDDISVIGIKFK